MDVVAHLKDFVGQHRLFRSSDKLLLAVSGGVDSMVLVHLLSSLGHTFGIAHCNFQLRGEESENDAAFVAQLAQRLNVPFFSKRFDVLDTAEEEGASIQMAARSLRYAWFEEVCDQHHFTCIVTAHHQNDVVETVLFNLAKGTGLSGLHGILPKRGRIVRPLLFLTKEDILQYAEQENLEWREDSSNGSDKYARNLIRRQVIPLLRQLNPNLEESVFHMTQHLQTVEKALLHQWEEKKQAFVSQKGGYIRIDSAQVMEEETPSLLLFYILSEYTFSHSVVDAILQSTTTGAVFYSPTHRVVKDRKYWIVDTVEKKHLDPVFLEGLNQEKRLPDGRVLKTTIREKEDFLVSASTLSLDFDKLHFPLVVRPWELGDKFVPYGMKGNKKVSDFLIDQKLHLFEKEKVLVLCSGGEIAGLLGYRPSQDFCVGEETRAIFEISLC